MDDRLAQWRNGTDFSCSEIGSLQAIKGAANSGDLNAQVYMAWLYWRGGECGVEKDESMSQSWTEKAAAQEDPEAELALAYFYEHGVYIGGSDSSFGMGSRYGRDKDKAVEYAMRAAKRGYPPAVGVGAKYLFMGRAAQESSADTYELYLWAGEHGDFASYGGAAMILHQGAAETYIMGEKDAADTAASLALTLFALAREGGGAYPYPHRLPHESRYASGPAEVAVHDLKSWLTPEQIAAAEQEASDWLAEIAEEAASQP